MLIILKYKTLFLVDRLIVLINKYNKIIKKDNITKILKIFLNYIIISFFFIIYKNIIIFYYTKNFSKIFLNRKYFVNKFLNTENILKNIQKLFLQ